MSRSKHKSQVDKLRKLTSDKKHKPGPPMGHVSIFTDASMHRGYRVGGYAYQITAKGFATIKKWGGFREQLHSIHEGELKAIALAIHHLFYKVGAPDGLTIYSDSVSALDMVADENQHEAYRELHQWVREEIKKRGMRTLSLKHVPAHSHADLRQSKINHWCDKFAKKGMKQRLKSWKKGNKGGE